MKTVKPKPMKLVRTREKCFEAWWSDKPGGDLVVEIANKICTDGKHVVVTVFKPGRIAIEKWIGSRKSDGLKWLRSAWPKYRFSR